MSKNHLFSIAPRFSGLPRSAFDRSGNYKTTLDAGYLVPFYCEPVLPGDTVVMDKISFFSRLTTLATPVMDNLYLDYFFFFVPNRLVWKHWTAMMGERKYPDSSIDYLVPTMTSPEGGYGIQSLFDYFKIRTGVGGITHSALPFRAYNLIYDEWFRDENLCTPTNMALEASYGDGPDDPSDYVLRKSGKRHDYYTSSLPFPMKSDPLTIALGSQAPVIGNGMALGLDFGTGTGSGLSNTTSGYLANSTGSFGNSAGSSYTGSAFNTLVSVGVTKDATKSGLIADLSSASEILVSTLRDTFQVQRYLERDARGGTRYQELLVSHFGVSAPDARVQIPELLHVGTADVSINTVVQTSESGTTKQGNLTGYGVINHLAGGFAKSFVEFGYLIGICRIRADLNYQQGTPREFFRKERFDFYFPEFACVSEQPVYNREIFTQGSSVVDTDGTTLIDDKVFGYQEAWADYRYQPNAITGKLRSDASGSLDVWHLAQDFADLPVLSQDFIEEDVPMSRVLAVTNEPAFMMDVHFKSTWTRPMPMYSVPGLVDHF